MKSNVELGPINVSVEELAGIDLVISGERVTPTEAVRQLIRVGAVTYRALAAGHVVVVLSDGERPRRLRLTEPPCQLLVEQCAGERGVKGLAGLGLLPAELGADQAANALELLDALGLNVAELTVRELAIVVCLAAEELATVVCLAGLIRRSR
ncbi:MAG: hypothetical protein ACRDTG_29095 [Pseudonocardiaceae bacterium]